MEPLTPAQATSLEALLRARTPALVAAMVDAMRDDLSMHSLALPPESVIQMGTESLVGALSAVLLLGTAEPLEEMARWQAALLRQRGVMAPSQATQRFLAHFDRAAHRCLAPPPELAPALEVLLAAAHAAFQRGYERSDE